jgi:hypothetical protein
MLYGRWRTGVLVWAAVLAAACTDVTKPDTLAPTEARRSIPPPSDGDCNENPFGIYCPRVTYDGGGSEANCPIPCQTYALSEVQKGSLYAALQKIHNTSGCQAVKNYVIGAIEQGRVRYWIDDPWAPEWGDAHVSGYAGLGLPDPFAQLHLNSKVFQSQHQAQAALTAMHEGAHGYYGWTSDTQAENFAVSCYNPNG